MQTILGDFVGPKDLLRPLLAPFWSFQFPGLQPGILARPDPCSVDFGSKAPKFRSQFCCGFLGWIFSSLSFPRRKARKNPPKNPPHNPPRNLLGKFPSDFCRILVLTFWIAAPGQRFAIAWTPHRSHSGPSGPKPPNSWKKGIWGLSTLGTKKCFFFVKVEYRLKMLEKVVFDSAWTLFRLSPILFSPGPKTFFNCLGIVGPKGPNEGKLFYLQLELLCLQLSFFA